MTTYISILREINVSGLRIIKMDALKTRCSKLKTQNYIVMKIAATSPIELPCPEIG
ncbi:MAG: DUF1697 domain-containing protein [Flavobacteriales bacterium]|nr:DUF1697 domain-containing protein [Flavobacteriales bacterium]